MAKMERKSCSVARGIAGMQFDSNDEPYLLLEFENSSEKKWLPFDESVSLLPENFWEDYWERRSE